MGERQKPGRFGIKVTATEEVAERRGDESDDDHEQRHDEDQLDEREPRGPASFSACWSSSC